MKRVGWETKSKSDQTVLLVGVGPWSLSLQKLWPPDLETLSQRALIMATLIHSDLPGLTLVSQGKVRDIYSTSSDDQLLFVATGSPRTMSSSATSVRVCHIQSAADQLCASGHPVKEPRADGHLPLLVPQATGYHPQPRRHRECRQDARGGAKAQGATGGVEDDGSKSKDSAS
jgi:hypothetical protein